MITILSLSAGSLSSEKGYKHQGKVYWRIELIKVTYLNFFLPLSQQHVIERQFQTQWIKFKVHSFGYQIVQLIQPLRWNLIFFLYTWTISWIFTQWWFLPTHLLIWGLLFTRLLVVFNFWWKKIWKTRMYIHYTRKSILKIKL